jgi:DUF4097 and DUF4098 domain-containing protein YvlB
MRGPLIAAAVLLACSGCVDLVGSHADWKVVEREDKRFPVTGRAAVTLSTFDGAIEVRPWDKPEVEVVIEKRGPTKESLADLVINATQNGDRIDVDVKSSRPHTGWHFGPSPNAKLIVSVPSSTDLVARSGDGSIDVERVDGKVELGSGDGSIRARDLNGDVDVHTGDGSIVLDGRFATLKARSGDGSVKIHAASGSNTSGDWDVTTGDGSITLEIPEGFNGDLDAHTGDGGVRVENVTVSDVSGEIRRNSLKGRIGSGGRQVRLRTGDGSITLRRS